MRSFPRAAAALTAVLVCAGVLTAPWHSSAAADHKHDLKHRHHQVQGRIHDAAADLEDASHEYVAATHKLAVATHQLVGARSHLHHVQRRLHVSRVHSAVLRRDLIASRTRLALATAALHDAQADTVAQRAQLRTIILNGETPSDAQLRAVGTLFSADSLDDLTSDLSSQDVVMNRSNVVYNHLQGVEQQLGAKQDDVAEATAEVGVKRRQAADHLAFVHRVYEQARIARNRVASLVDDARSARRQARHAKARDRVTLKRLRQREDKIAQRLRELARRQHGTGYNGASNGFLDYPVNGPITSPFGYRIHPIYGYYSLHNGTDFGVPCGTPAHASAAGTVIDEYYDSVYGNRLYLSVGNVNGKNLTLVYNHLTNYVAHEGQRVARGDVVAHTGTTGWSTGCHLHFTVLVNGVAVDPVRYL